MIRRQLRGGTRWVVVIALLFTGALLSIGYILTQQNLRFPGQDRYTIHAEFTSAAGLTAGLGQPVNVAGVRVGTIRDVVLRDGRAVAELEIKPGRLRNVYRDARAVLIPTSALKDLRIEVVPGNRAAGTMPDGGVIPVARTTPPTDADQLLAGLDGDTRSLLAVLIGETGRATDGRGPDLRALLRAVGPTAQQVKGISRTLARRQREVRRLVTNLATLSRAIGPRDADITRVVEGTAATARALAGEQRALGDAIEELPGTLRTVRGTLARTAPFAREARASLQALQPVLDRLPATLQDVEPLAREAGPITRDRLRPAVRELQPIGRDLGALTPDLVRVTPFLSSAFRVLTYTVNELAFNPPGDDEGLLYWLAWSAHNVNSVVSTGDAHGGTARAVALFDCGTVLDQPQLAPLAAAVLGSALPTCPQEQR